MERLADDGYWIARAAKHLANGKHSIVVQLCKEHLIEEPATVSGRLIYAMALYRAGQQEAASEQFHRVLSLDPDHVVALKYLGDIKFAVGDQPAAMANYRRVLQIDSQCQGLRSTVLLQPRTVTRTITLAGKAEPKPERVAGSLRKIPFYTETIGDLYMEQGCIRLAAEVYRHLHKLSENPRLADKLQRAEGKIREKEH